MFDASASMFDQRKSQRPEGPQKAWDEAYRDRWKWDKVFWGSHCVDCYPGNCPYRVYVRGDKVVREEVGCTFPVIEPGVPDMNPMGCQKGAAWSQLLYSKERVLHPLKRAGERGEGKWQRISWDQALTEIADAMLDTIQEYGPDSIINEGTPAQGGLMSGMFLSRVTEMLGGVHTDVNAVINDFSPGLYLTFGKFNPANSSDDWFHSKLIIFTHINPVYTEIQNYHYWAEARYNGGEVVTIAPDCSPSTIHADYYVPVKPGTDAALALAMCQVIIEEGLYDKPFVQDQTDLPLLVRSDNQRFLRGSDVEERGLEDQFYFYDSKSQQVVEAPRGTLALGDIDPALEGSYQATLSDGTLVEVRPVFELLRERLREYTPEDASKVCGTNPEVIRTLARKVATTRTAILNGATSFKYYHADLQVRSYLLAAGLTGNWGKKGTGPIEWSTGQFDGPFIYHAKQRPGQEETANLLALRALQVKAVKERDPTLTDEMAGIQLMHEASPMTGTVPPVFFWYYHCGYQENWNNRQWNDPSMSRPFDSYMQEALEKGWWKEVARPGPDTPPRVYIECGGNVLRRTRGGQTQLLKHLWPKLKLIVTVDWRMNTTGLYSDIFLPVAHHYEKMTFHIPNPQLLFLCFSDRATEPAGDTKSEFEISLLLSRKIEERARARGMSEFVDNQGNPRRLDNLHDTLTLGGELVDEESVADEWVRDTAAVGTLPKHTNLQTMREKGYVRFIDWGVSPFALNQAAPLRPDETHAAFRWHTEDKLPYPTLTRRAQFYIDHDWFLEAGEELPMHKDNPMQGGDYPFQMTSGHNRWSIHSMNITNRLMLETHQGRPFIFMNNRDARERGIENGEEVRVHNDMGSFCVPVKISPSVMPGQIISYNGFEPYMYREWKDAANVEPGMVKWLHLAGGYGHLRYWVLQWQPAPIDRAIRVKVEKVG
ncbi:MAG: molybdopterin-dependent oxidoreductase [Dehalococcoidia bacterium]